MKKKVFLSSIGLFVSLILFTYAFSLTLYDDFSGTYIDKTKWRQGEWVIEIVGGKLVSKSASPNPDTVSSFPYIGCSPHGLDEGVMFSRGYLLFLP
jgi:hypothetical protein